MISTLPFPDDAANLATPLMKFKSAVREYLSRLKGEGIEPPPLITLSWDAVASVVLSLVTLLVLAFIQHWGFAVRDVNLHSIIPAFGASAALVFGATQVHAAQPRAVLIGFLIGGTLGVTAEIIFRNAAAEGDRKLLSIQMGAALAVSLTLVLMKITSTIHPPSCAAATFAAAFTTPRGENDVNDQGYLFLATPVLLGATVLILCAWLGNNLVPRRKHYPAVW